MPRNRTNPVEDFFRGFNMGYGTVGQVLRDRDLGEVANAQPMQAQGYTADDGKQLENIANAKDADGKPLYNLTANEDGSYTVADAANPSNAGVIAQRGVTDFLGQRTAGSLSPGQAGNARAIAAAGIIGRTDPIAAIRIRRDVTADERDEQRFSWDRDRAMRVQREADQVDADRAQLRNALAGGESGDSSGLPTARDLAMGGINRQARAATPAQTMSAYADSVAPSVVKTLLQQGRIEDAKHFQDFVAGERGRQYAEAWQSGVRHLAVGDQDSALRSFEQLYNRSFDDGNTVKLTALPDGKSHRVELFDADGNSLGTKTGTTADLARESLLALDPVQAARFHAQEQSRRQGEAAVLDRQLEVERLRQQGRESTEDHRDQRATDRLASQNARRSSLTAVQERGNAEIDAARQRVAGMDPAEIRRRTAKATSTGRENLDYDAGLAHAAALAARRKIGDDPDFEDAQARRSPAAGAGAGAGASDVSKRFGADPAMKGYRLGPQTANGFEVRDSTGRLLGHYH